MSNDQRLNILLLWIGWIYNHGILRLLIYNQVCIVVATSNPYIQLAWLDSKVTFDIHIGIDWICMFRFCVACDRIQ